MKLVKSANHISFLDRILNKDSKAKTAGLTREEERREAENKAVEHSEKRKVEAAKYPKISTSNEDKPGFRNEVTDEHYVVQNASKVLKEHVSELVGKGGFTLDLDEFRPKQAHRDIVNDSHVTDSAIVAFAVKFMLPKKDSYKTAKFIVSYDQNADEKNKVEGVFFDENTKEYTLTSQNLKGYLNNTENDAVKTANTEKTLVWFNPDSDTIEAVNTVETTTKIASRLKSAGFDIDSNYWVDSTYGPKQFGKICVFANVPLSRADEFKKIAALSDDEWVNRGAEKTYKQKEVKDWTERTTEKAGYDHSDYKKGDEWVNRTEQKGGDNNPYGTDAKMLSSDAMRKDAVKQALEGKVADTTMEKIEKLEKLLG